MLLCLLLSTQQGQDFNKKAFSSDSYILQNRYVTDNSYKREIEMLVLVVLTLCKRKKDDEMS